MALSLADANRIIGASIAEAERIGVKLSVAVVDGGGQLVAFQRMEGAIAVSATAAPGKAVGSVFFGRDSRESTRSPVNAGDHQQPGRRDHPGRGRSIYQDGAWWGRSERSGGTGQEDEDCVRRGGDAVRGPGLR